jgi:AcrR family transcriptional regulator
MKQTANGGDAAATADRLWTAAAELFRDRGYAAATTRELADRLGITRATLYYHVAKKEDLLYGICREALERVQKAVSDACEAVDDPRLRLEALVRAHLLSMLTDIPMHATMMLNFDALTGPYRDEVVAMRNKYEKYVVAVIADAQRDGVLRSDVSARNLTLTLMNLLNWTITWYRPGTGRDPQASRRLTPETLAELYLSVFLNGALS